MLWLPGCLAFAAADALAGKRCHFVTCICRCMLPGNCTVALPCPVQPLPMPDLPSVFVLTCAGSTLMHAALTTRSCGPAPAGPGSTFCPLPFFKPLA